MDRNFRSHQSAVARSDAHHDARVYRFGSATRKTNADYAVTDRSEMKVHTDTHAKFHGPVTEFCGTWFTHAIRHDAVIAARDLMGGKWG